MLNTSPPKPAPLGPDDEDEAPLDPAMERVRRKLTILLAVSTGVMVLGFLAVVIAIFYRVSQMDAADGPARVALEIAHEDLVSARADGEHIVFTIAGDAPRVEVREIDGGALVATFTMGAQGEGAAADEAGAARER